MSKNELFVGGCSVVGKVKIIMGTLNIIIGDITSDEILKEHDLIINLTNPRMVCGMGVSQSIFHKVEVEQLESYT